jgi:putative DNA primase/helicase
MNMAKTYNGQAGRKRLLELVRAEKGLSISSSEFDPDHWLINVENGTIDLKKGKLLGHDSAHRCTKIAPVIFDPKAKCPRFHRFLEGVLPDKDTIAFVQRFIGYCLTGSTSEQVLLFCYGVGANGKTVLVETIQALLGDYAVTGPTSLLMAKQFDQHPCDRMPLRGARMAAFSEIPGGRRFDEATLKALTGSDQITGRGMRENPTFWRPTHKIVISGNHKPDIRGTDVGIWRRIRLLEFGKVIPEGKRDKRLPEKLRAELSGILSWAVRGCLAWQQAGLRESERVIAATAEYKEESDRLRPFLEEKYLTAPDGVVTRAEVYGQYSKWAEDLGARRMTDREFAESMRRLGMKECFKRDGKLSVRAWRGLAPRQGGSF